MTRSLAIRTWARGALILCLSAMTAEASTAPALAQARDSAGAQNIPSPQPPTQASATQNAEDVTTLDLGKPLERDIAGSQKHSYQIALVQGEYAGVVVEQRGVDVVVKSFDIDGKLLAEFDSENRPNGLERAELVATAAGMYKFEVEVRYKMPHGGRYEIRLAETRGATGIDRLLEEARELHTKAYYAIIAGGEKNREEAQAMLEKALDIREKTIGPNHPDIAFTLTLLANIAYYRQDFAKAEPLYQRAIAMLEKTLPPEHPQVAMRLNNLGIIYLNRNDFTKSEQLHKRALEIRERSLAPDHPDIAQSLINLANVYTSKGDLLNAEPLLLRAVAIFENVFGPDNMNVSYPLVNLGGIYLSQKDYDKAGRVLERARAIWEQKFGKDHHMVADVLHDLGDVHRGKRDYAKA